MTAFDPVFTIGHQIVETIRTHREAIEARGARGGRAPAAPRRDRQRRRCARLLSAPAVRRHAAARDDRDGALLPAQAADRRRADHRARRHHPGADPAAHQGAAGRVRHGADHDHARPRRHRRDRRPRRRHVRRPGDGRGTGAADLRCARRTATRSRCSRASGPEQDPAGSETRRRLPRRRSSFASLSKIYQAEAARPHLRTARSTSTPCAR